MNLGTKFFGTPNSGQVLDDRPKNLSSYADYVKASWSCGKWRKKGFGNVVDCIIYIYKYTFYNYIYIYMYIHIIYTYGSVVS